MIKLDTAAAISRRGANSRTVISSDARRPILDLGELWAYRAVLYGLVWRELKVRYAQTFAGAAWVILQPALTTVVLGLLAGRVMKVPADGLPYPLFAFSGLVIWMYFTHVLTKACISLINTGLLSKAYFPRLLMPLASAVGGMIDCFVAAIVLGGMMIYYRAAPHWSLLLLPVCLLAAMIVAFGIGVWLSVLNLYNRDISHALPFTIQLLFFLTPVAYPASLVPPAWRLAYSLNPMVGIIECWRWILFATPLNISLPQLAASLAVGAVVIVTGLWYFSHEEPTFADVGET